MGKAGFKHIVYTDIARDGMQTGLDMRAYVQMAEAFGHPVIASGGVKTYPISSGSHRVASSIEGVITGRPYMEGTLTVEEGVAACGGNEVAMLAKRVIPCMDVKDGRVVKGVNFVNLRDAGDPIELAQRYDEQRADEVIFLDITATSDDRATTVKTRQPRIIEQPPFALIASAAGFEASPISAR